jgi:hypothetical protein
VNSLLARIERLEALIKRALGGGSKSIQAGTTTLVAGTKTVTGFRITATSRIVAQFNTAAGGGGATVKLDTPTANRVVGAPGTFDIQALTSADVVNGMDTSTVDFVIIG